MSMRRPCGPREAVSCDKNCTAPGGCSGVDNEDYGTGKNSHQGLDHVGFAAGKKASTVCSLLEVTARFKVQASMTQSVSNRYEDGIV